MTTLPALVLRRAKVEISGGNTFTGRLLVRDGSAKLVISPRDEITLEGVTVEQQGTAYVLTGENGVVWTARRAGGCGCGK